MHVYLQQLEEVLTNGMARDDRTGVGTVGLFGMHAKYDLGRGFPLLTTKRVYFKGIVEELLWFLSGDTNNTSLSSKKVGIWNEWEDEYKNLGPIYSAMWRRWPVNTLDGVVLDIRPGPAPGAVDLGHKDFGSLTSEYSGDLPTHHDNFDEPYRIVKDLGVVGKNSSYLIQFDKTGYSTVVSRPNIKQGVRIKDPYYPTIHGVACMGIPGREYPRGTYDLWYNMVSRCYNPANSAYEHYGALGVYVSPRWLCFETFLNDLGRIPYYEQWCRNPNKYHLDKDYFGSKCYDVTTVVFIDSELNRGLARPTRPMYSINPHGLKRIYGSRTDLVEDLHVSDETLRTHMAGAVSPKLLGWEFGDIDPVPGKIVRRKLFTDQITDLIEELKTNPFSRRLIVTGWNPEVLPDTSYSPKDNATLGKQALPPCHTLFQFYTNRIPLSKRTQLLDRPPIGLDLAVPIEAHQLLDDLGVPRLELSCQLYQRSGDMFLGVPFNIASYALLTMMVAQVVGMAPGWFHHTLGDAHIYKNHIDQVKEQLSRTPKELPTLKINQGVRSIFDFKFEDFELVGYDPLPGIKAPVAV